MRLSKILFFLPAILLTLLITYLSHQPNLPIKPLFPGYDKLLHFIAFFVYGLSWQIGFIGSFSNMKKRNVLWIVLIIGACFGAADELHQYYVPYRVASFWDFTADLAGIATSLLFYSFIKKIIYSRKIEKE